MIRYSSLAFHRNPKFKIGERVVDVYHGSHRMDSHDTFGLDGVIAGYYIDNSYIVVFTGKDTSSIRKEFELRSLEDVTIERKDVPKDIKIGDIVESSSGFVARVSGEPTKDNSGIWRVRVTSVLGFFEFPPIGDLRKVGGTKLPIDDPSKYPFGT